MYVVAKDWLYNIIICMVVKIAPYKVGYGFPLISEVVA